MGFKLTISKAPDGSCRLADCTLDDAAVGWVGDDVKSPYSALESVLHRLGLIAGQYTEIIGPVLHKPFPKHRGHVVDYLFCGQERTDTDWLYCGVASEEAQVLSSPMRDMAEQLHRLRNGGDRD